MNTCAAEMHLSSVVPAPDQSRPSHGLAGSLRLDVGRPDYLAPLLGFLCDELAEVGGRARKYLATEFGHPSLHRRLGERRVDFLVELVNDLGRGAFGNAEAEPAGYRVARDNIANQRAVRQHPQTRRGRPPKRAQ